MTQLINKKLRKCCDHCQSMLDKPCAWLSLGNEYCEEIMEVNKEIDRLNNVINELEKYHIKSMENLENTEDFKYVGINHIKILYEEHKRTLDKLKELKEEQNGQERQ